MNDTLAAVLDRLDAVTTAGAGYSARCPAHDDRVASLSVSEGDASDVVMHCHAGCTTEAVTAALGLSMADLCGAPRLMASYPYHAADGRLLYTVQRWAPKTFRVDPGLPPLAERVLFAMDWVHHARTHDQMLYVVEGERDAVTLIDTGVPATTNVGGAGKGKWLPQYSDALAGIRVTVVADDDDPGRRHARAVAASLQGVAKSVTLATPAYGKDVTELLAAGYGLDHLAPLPEELDLPVLNASTVPLRRVQWVWPQYMPLGKLTTIEGDPGGGKSTLTIDLVARWSTGAPMPDGVAHNGPYHCLMISAEDDPEDTVVPRLIAAGADLNRVHLLASGADPSEPFNLGVDLDTLEKTLRTLNVKILVLDPLSAFLPTDSDSHSDASIRRALYPVHLLARRLSVAVLAVRHLSKSATKAIHAGNGSIGIIAAARAAFMVGPAPDDATRRILAPIKCNLSAPPPTLDYSIQIDPRTDVGRAVWGGVVEISAQDVLDGEKGREERSRAAEAREFLRATCDLQETKGQPLTWRQIVERGQADGFAEITMRRVRDSVLGMAINPIRNSGDVLTGTYWFVRGQADTWRDLDQALISAGPYKSKSKPSECSTESDEYGISADDPPAPLCPDCNQSEELVPPRYFWYACPRCTPATFIGER